MSDVELLPLVTVIVPMHAVERYIGECVESICNQTYENIEVILVDDGSPDESGLIADQYSLEDSRVGVIHQQNAGVSAARNAGLDSATGEYVCFVDGDDRLAPDFVSHMVAQIHGTSADMAMGTRVLSRGLDETAHYSHSGTQLTGEQATVRLIYADIPIGCWNKIFRRSAVERNKLRFSTDLYMGEGLRFITDVSQRAELVVATDRPLYFYRRDNSASATTSPDVQRMRNAISAFKRIRDGLVLDSNDIRSALDFHGLLLGFTTLRAIQASDAPRDPSASAIARTCREMVRKPKLKLLWRAPVNTGQRMKATAIWLAPNTVVKAAALFKRRR